MKKEVLVAIFIGLSLGLIVAYGIYTARKSMLNFNRLTSGEPSPTPSGMLHNSITLISPEDESVQSTSQVKITGTTDPESIIVAFVNNKENISTADSSGNFSFETTLESGANIITVKAIDEDGNSAEVQRTVIFTTVPFEEAPTASSSASPSPKPKASPTPTKSASPKPSPSPTGGTR